MKQHPLLGHLIQMRRLRYFATVTTKIIPRDVIGDKQDKVRFVRSLHGKRDQQYESKQEFHGCNESEYKLSKRKYS